MVASFGNSGCSVPLFLLFTKQSVSRGSWMDFFRPVAWEFRVPFTQKSMVTPLPPLDPINDTLLFSAGTVLLPLGPQEPAKCQSEPPANKRRVHSWAIVVVAGLCLFGVAMPVRRAESLPQPVEPVASIKATPSLGFVVKPAALPEPGAHDTRVAFVCSPAEAARLATADRKLCFLLHVSGDFDDSEFT